MRMIQFRFMNYRSFRDETVLDFRSTWRPDEPQYRSESKFARHGLLPVLALFGANASGKTNAVDALLECRQMVRKSFGLHPDADIPHFPWRPNRNAEARPTMFELEFQDANVKYQYGFAYTKDVVVEEWLYRWQSSRKQVLFERERDGSEDVFRLGRRLGSGKDAVTKLTRSNCLYLSAGAQAGHTLLTDVYKSIIDGINEEAPISLRGSPVFVEDSPILLEKNSEIVKSALQDIDIGCIGFEVEELPGADTLLSELKDALKPEALERVREAFTLEKKMYQIVLRRRDSDGAGWSVQPYMESRGTNVILQRLNDLLGMKGGVLVVDELDTSLHPHLCRGLVDLFTSSLTNPEGTQLLFTTHDTGVMEYLRRDEVLIVDKGLDGDSTLLPVSSIRGLRGRASIRDAYEAGALQGVPGLGALEGVLGVRTGSDR